MSPYTLGPPYDIHRDGVPETAPPVEVPPVIARRLVELAEQREGLIVYLMAKVKAGDFHAVQDAASDIREVDAQILILRTL